MPHNPDIFIHSLLNELKPVTPLRQSTGMVQSLLALTVGVLAFCGLLGLRPDIASGQPHAMVLTSSGLFLVLALASAWAAIDMARPHVGTNREGWGWTALMAGVLPIAALALAASALWHGRDVALDMGGIACMGFGIMVGLITATMLTLWLRKGAPTNPQRAGLLTGVASGSAGIFAVSLHCPHSNLLHIGIWHGLTVVLMGVIGMWVGPRLIRW